jgi:phosphoribosylanthranilate isomerase
MKVKICGLTRREDVELAVSLGATHVGCVSVKDSPRHVDSRVARRLLAGLSDAVTPVLVLRTVAGEEAARKGDAAGVRTLQLHRSSEEAAIFLEHRGYRVHRVVEVTGTVPDLPTGPARIFHLDTGGGGTGRRFDWKLLGATAPPFTFLAGGITPDNVRQLLPLHPHGIDLSSGVEASPGIKDPRCLRALFAFLRGRPVAPTLAQEARP